MTNASFGYGVHLCFADIPTVRDSHTQMFPPQTNEDG